ncbi:hypothetical protein IEQ34_003975 [Dendrobium chrysotoxum]|uniref:Uncharacterized protein n=1 Tax=Dendrobium chrysotoxum TaxID=161865 RepID=A0AAV7HCW6_DENCH|nr:hypothetical protein IEQ34_003975 [Dendrobium chrysotoxum]
MLNVWQRKKRHAIDWSRNIFVNFYCNVEWLPYQSSDVPQSIFSVYRLLVIAGVSSPKFYEDASKVILADRPSNLKRNYHYRNAFAFACNSNIEGYVIMSC